MVAGNSVTTAITVMTETTETTGTITETTGTAIVTTGTTGNDETIETSEILARKGTTTETIVMIIVTPGTTVMTGVIIALVLGTEEWARVAAMDHAEQVFLLTLDKISR